MLVAVGRRARLRRVLDEPVIADRASPRSRARLRTVADWPSMSDRASPRSRARLRTVADGMRVVTDRAAAAVVIGAEERHLWGRVRGSGSENEHCGNACNPDLH